MAFKNRDLSVMSYANGVTIWSYSTDEKPEHVLGKGYFNPVNGLMHSGDVIFIHCLSDERPSKVYLRSVYVPAKEVILIKVNS